jgi:hypothetical protein
MFVVLISGRTEASYGSLVNEEIRLALHRREADPSYRIIPVRLDPDIGQDSFAWQELSQFHWLDASKDDIQRVVVEIRDLLGRSSTRRDDRDQAARVRNELERALQEQDSLRGSIDRLEEDLTECMKERGVLEERTRQLQSDAAECADSLEGRVREIAELTSLEDAAASTNYRLRVQRVVIGFVAVFAILFGAYSFWGSGRVQLPDGEALLVEIASSYANTNATVELLLAYAAVEAGESEESVDALRHALASGTGSEPYDSMSVGELITSALNRLFAQHKASPPGGG